MGSRDGDGAALEQLAGGALDQMGGGALEQVARGAAEAGGPLESPVALKGSTAELNSTKQ